jgi:NADH-quinone oxidoreductase subunit C
MQLHQSNVNNKLLTISELFSAANWLEREIGELHGITFIGKKDIRNLLLQYGDSSMPFKKSFPTIGLNELYYDPIKDHIQQIPVSIQI